MFSGILICHLNHLRQGETRIWVASSGILIIIRITFDKEKRGQAMLSSGILINIWITFDKERQGCLWHLNVFSLIFELPSNVKWSITYSIIKPITVIVRTASTIIQLLHLMKAKYFLPNYKMYLQLWNSYLGNIERRIYLVIPRYSRIRRLKIPSSHIT
jgi:hypothetical protein